jgi:hypothetical protein
MKAGKVLATVRNDIDGVIQFCRTEVKMKSESTPVKRYYIRFWTMGKEGIVDAHTIPLYEHEMIGLVKAMLEEAEVVADGQVKTGKRAASSE